MKYIKKEIIAMIKTQHEEDLRSLISFLEKVLPNEIEIREEKEGKST